MNNKKRMMGINSSVTSKETRYSSQYVSLPRFYHDAARESAVDTQTDRQPDGHKAYLKMKEIEQKS